MTTPSTTVIYKLLPQSDYHPYKYQKDGSDAKVFPTVKVPNEDQIVDENGRTKWIRYIYGVPTIDRDKQVKELNIPLKYAFNTADRLYFIGDTMVCDTTKDKTLVEFMDSLNMNASNTKRSTKFGAQFEKIDLAKNAQATIDKNNLTFDAIAMLQKHQDDEQAIRRIGRQMSYNVERSAKEIYADLQHAALSAPKLLTTAILTMDGDLEDLIRDGLSNGVLFANATKCVFRDGDQETVLVTYQGGTKEADVRKKLSKYLNSPQGEGHRGMLKRMVEAQREQTVKEAVV
jgi:hypothetical protein